MTRVERSAAERSAVHPLLATVFAQLDGADVSWALLRGGDALAVPHGDVDVLVSPLDLDRALETLADCGFVPTRSPGHGSHRFLFARTEQAAGWIKLDLVSELAFGPRQELVLGPAALVLGGRQRAAMLWSPATEDELWLLLLHWLLDKEPAPRVVGLARQLQAEQLRGRVADHLDDVLGRGTAAWLLGRLLAPAADLQAVGLGLAARWSRVHPTTTRLRRLRSALGRRLLPGPRLGWGQGVALVLLGPDGAGKSTLSQALPHAVPLRCRSLYLGLWQVRPRGALTSLPGLRTLGRLARGGGALGVARLRLAAGEIVVLDRSPHDGLLPDSDHSRGGRLVTRVLLVLLPASCLLAVLDLPGEEMYRRKGEHSAGQLEARRQAYLGIARSSPRALVTDASRSRQEVLLDVTSAVWAEVRSVRRGPRGHD